MRLENVAFRYRRKDPWVFRGVTLDLAGGSVTEVTGHNGVGKSTLLRVIAGLRRPRVGVVMERPDRVGYAPERFPVDQPFSVRTYLGHMAAIRRVPADAVGGWAERLGFDHLLDVRLPELSKGSAQKVGIAQALMADPELLILDEPFAGLDAATRDALPGLISELASGGTTVVVSDHQRCIEDMPGIDRLHMSNGSVARLPLRERTEDPTSEPTGSGASARSTGQTKHGGPGAARRPEYSAAGSVEEPERAVPARGGRTERAAPESEGRDEWVVLEVEVPGDEVDTLETKLRADGYPVRRRDR